MTKNKSFREAIAKDRKRLNKTTVTCHECGTVFLGKECQMLGEWPLCNVMDVAVTCGIEPHDFAKEIGQVMWCAVCPNCIRFVDWRSNVPHD